MSRIDRRRVRRYAAGPLCLLACAGMYFGARALSDTLFHAALEAAEETVPQVREGESRFNALSLREQRLYDVICDAMEARDTETARVSFAPTAQEFQDAFYAVLYDHPLYCDVIPRDCRLQTTRYSGVITLAYEAEGEQMRQALEARAASLCAALTQGGADSRRMLLNLHAALTDLCMPAASDAAGAADTAYDALIGGCADGFGYALAFSLLCETVGIACDVVTGEAAAEGVASPHAWNAVTLDGVTGYTDVMWNDAPVSGEDDALLSFHGYYHLSLDEMAYDHTPDGTLPLSGGDTVNYYEAADACITDADSLAPALQRILSDARASGDDCAELYLSPTLVLTDYQLEEHLQTAIAAANAVIFDGDVPKLRAVNRIYHAAQAPGAVTVRLFYEEEPSSGDN